MSVQRCFVLGLSLVDLKGILRWVLQILLMTLRD